MKFDKTDKVLIGLVALALGTSASIGIVNNNRINSNDKNTCVLKNTMVRLAERSIELKQENWEEAVAFYRDLDSKLRPVQNKTCDDILK